MDYFKREYVIGTADESIEFKLSLLAEKLSSKDSKYTFLFVSPDLNCQDLGNQFQQCFGDSVVAVTTAGEINSVGYLESSISGLALHGDVFGVEELFIKDLSRLEDSVDDIQATLKKVRENEKSLGEEAKTFAALMIDGLSVKEEIVTEVIGNVIEDIPLVGGSAGDNLAFGHTYVLHDGKFQENVAKIIFVTTTIPFETFKVQHFKETNKKLVITESIPEKRIVTEIDGEPAADAYASHLDMPVTEFTTQAFSENPVMLKIGDEYFVRSIQQVNEDNSMTFYCAIDDGLVLTLADREDFYTNTLKKFEEIEKRVGEVSCSFLFECILRRIEVLNKSEEEQMKINELYQKYKTVGFHTYGEQYGSIHINQTLTGVIFGK
jgi:hypothetical protein